jgi:hypothetical protein
VVGWLVQLEFGGGEFVGGLVNAHELGCLSIICEKGSD